MLKGFLPRKHARPSLLRLVLQIPGNRWSLITGLVGALMLLGVLDTANAQSRDANVDRDCSVPGFPAPTLCARAGLDTVPASYLYVVDESGSMRPLWEGVRGALATFAEAVPNGSELDVRLFAGTARQRIPATVSSPSARRNWAHELGTMPTPTGAHTDLGRAAKAVIEKLRAAPSDRLQFVFFLTDGEQDPPPGSPYTTVWNAAWDELAREARSVTKSRPVKVGIVRLTPSADQHFLGRVFPEAVSTDAMTSDALRRWFDNQMAEAAVEKLLLLVNHDLRREIRIDAAEVYTYAARPREVTLPLRSERRLVSSFVPAGTPLELPGGGTFQVRSDVTIEPGETRDVPFTLADAEYPVYLPPGTRTRVIDQTLALQARPGPIDELRLIGADTDFQTANLLPNLRLVGGGALSWPLYILVSALLLAVAAGLGIWTKWKLHRPYLPGRLVIRHAPQDGSDAPQEETVILSGRKLQVYRVVRPDGRSSVTYQARSERGRTVVYAEPGDDEVTVAGKQLLAPQVVSVKKVSRFESNQGEITYFPR